MVQKRSAPPIILVAEDCEITRALICKLIGSLGVATIQASNGRVAYDILHDNPAITVFLTDISMPELDGRDLIKKLRSEQKFEALPIVAISGVVGPKEISNLLKDGVTFFLPKPVNPDDVKEYCSRLLKKAVGKNGKSEVGHADKAIADHPH